MVDQRLPLVVAICTALGAVLALVFLVPSPLGRIAMVVGVIAAAVAAGSIDRWRRLDSLLEFSPRPRSRLRAQQVGAKASAVAHKRFPKGDPPYIKRERYDDALDSALRSRRFVVVKGVTNSGKTRAVFEAIGRVFPDSKIVLPNDPTGGDDALGELLADRWLLGRRGRYVLVINDLENRLSALQGFAVRKWLRAHPRSRIVATLSAEHWAELLAEERTPSARAATKLLGIAAEVPIGAEFNGAPLLKAQELYGLPRGKKRLGAYLASADRAIARFEATTGEALGAARAIALSGVNCARAGLVRPVGVDKLALMARRVCEVDGRHFDDAQWRTAVEYCTELQDGVGAILETRAASHGSRSGGITANPAVVERVDRGASGTEANPQLPDYVWDAIVEIVADGPYDLLRVASAASWRGRPDLAERLFEEVARRGGGPGEIAASRLREPERFGEPQSLSELLERASVGPDPRHRSPRSEPRVEAPPPGSVFDPRMRGRRRWRSFYVHQAVRDALRFVILLFFDLAAVFAGIAIAQRLGAVAFAGSKGFGSSSLAVAFIAATLTLVFFLLFGLYRADRERARLPEILKSTALAAVALSLWVIGRGYALLNLPLALAAAAAASGLAFLFRWIYDRVSRAWVRRNGLQSRALLIAAERPTRMAELIRNGCRRPMQIVGYLSAATLEEPGRLGGPDALARIATDLDVDRVIIADPTLSPETRLPLIYQCHALDLVTEVVPTNAELFQGATHALDDMVAPLLRVPPLYLNYVDKVAKRALDLVVAAPLSLLALPFLFAVAVLLKLESPGERILTWEHRPGLGAVLFPMPRLRTQRRGSPTALGRLLERLRLNEVPQLFNVLDGTMSLVGPRPLSSGEFEELDVLQRARHAVTPGITGLWQVARRRESSLDDMSSLDIVYCRKWTPLLDLTILLLTVPAVAAAPPYASFEGTS